ERLFAEMSLQLTQKGDRTFFRRATYERQFRQLFLEKPESLVRDAWRINSQEAKLAKRVQMLQADVGDARAVHVQGAKAGAVLQPREIGIRRIGRRKIEVLQVLHVLQAVENLPVVGGSRQVHGHHRIPGPRFIDVELGSYTEK